MDQSNQNIRYKNYTRRSFKEWKNKVCDHLPYFVTEFYKIKKYVDYHKHVLLGRVIANINNPAYAIVDEDGKRLDYQNEMAMEVLLELQVQELFSFIAKNVSRNEQ